MLKLDDKAEWRKLNTENWTRWKATVLYIVIYCKTSSRFRFDWIPFFVLFLNIFLKRGIVGEKSNPHTILYMDFSLFIHELEQICFNWHELVHKCRFCYVAHTKQYIVFLSKLHFSSIKQSKRFSFSVLSRLSCLRSTTLGQTWQAIRKSTCSHSTCSKHY